jgi:hypothetical protein
LADVKREFNRPEKCLSINQIKALKPELVNPFMHTSAAAKKYIRSFLTSRTATLVLCTYEDKSPATLSPVLFLFFASTPLPQLNSGATAAIGFVDDTNIPTFS